MRKVLALATAAMLLTGCALAQGSMLTDNTARITSRANSPANRDRVIHDALAEAARLTRAQGYRYFIILDATDESRIADVDVLSQIVRTRGNAAIPASSTSSSLGRVLNNPGTNVLTSASRVEILRPGLNITIRMYREGEIDPGAQGVWNAEGPLMIEPVTPVPEPTPAPRRRGPSTLRG